MEVFGATATGVAEGSWDDVAVACRQIQVFKRQVHSDSDGVAFNERINTAVLR